MEDVEDGDSNAIILKNGTNTKPESDKNKRDIGEFGIWTLSSAKAGNGIEQLRDDNVNTFWQSDGSQPHFVNVQFLKKFREIWIYLDYKTDESYTPNRLSVKVENSFNEMVEVKLVDFEEPSGWFKLALEDRNSKGEVIKPYMKTMSVKIIILQNIHNGRDTHIRNIKLFSPREHKSFDFNNPNFNSVEYNQFKFVR